jgi:hypothetical protein
MRVRQIILSKTEIYTVHSDAYMVFMQVVDQYQGLFLKIPHRDHTPLYALRKDLMIAIL